VTVPQPVNETSHILQNQKVH